MRLFLPRVATSKLTMQIKGHIGIMEKNMEVPIMGSIGIIFYRDHMGL